MIAHPRIKMQIMRLIRYLLSFLSVLKYVTMTTSFAPNVDRNQPLDKEILDQEKLMMENMKVIFKSFQGSLMFYIVWLQVE